jgi:hypothetical protein
MSEHELEKLLGGFAADTLTPEERQKLFTAALQDQQLFNALADEEALKELLTDPVVRRRLMQALQQTSTSGAGGSLSWLDWFRRPAGLAFAGGLAAAVFAIVLGTKIYQDSLKQAPQSVASEDAKPLTPSAPVTSPPAAPVIESQMKTKEKMEPLFPGTKREVLQDKLTKREQPAKLSTRAEQPTAGLARDNALPQPEADESHRQQPAAATPLSKEIEQPAAVAGKQKEALNTPSIAAAPEPVQMQPPATTPLAGAIAPAVSARALFYAGEPGRPDQRAMAAEKEQGLKSILDAPQANRPERKMERFSEMGKAAGTPTQLKPLGLRYSFVIRKSDGQEREVDAATASKETGQARLTVEANQDGYLQIWKTVGSSMPELLFPEKAAGQISMKILAGQQQNIALPMESGTVTLTARLSRVPFGPITRQEAAMLDRPSPSQLHETTASSGSQEQATYVVNQDPSPTSQITVEISFSR